MLNESVITTTLNHIPPTNARPQSTKKKAKAKGKEKASTSTVKEELSWSQLQDSKDPCDYSFDLHNPKILKNWKQQLWENEHKLQNLPWWKQAEIPSDSDNSDILRRVANLGTP
ncbi:hypothetical protein Adt_05490 [Abeliophyllum distichum]|uniref:Uncharacterized protein n=1 Tax=Abeliophyllum distichum TaxID=126358 RepID=A0ABD1V485_9LAMI